MTAQAINDTTATNLTNAVRTGDLKISCSEATLANGETEWLPVIRQGNKTYIFNPEFEVQFAKSLAADLTAEIMDDEPLDAEDWVVIDKAERTPCARREITGIK